MYGKFKFFSLNKKSDWEKGVPVNLDISPEGELMLKRNERAESAPDMSEASVITRNGGAYYSTSFDSRENDLQWHKLALTADIYEDASIKIYCHASNYNTINLKNIKDGNDELKNTDDFIKDDSIGIQEKQVLLEKLWSFWTDAVGGLPVVNAADALLHHMKGRYLWIKIEITGHVHKDIRISRLRLYYPRMSFLSYLPGVYQEDETGRGFLENFLSIFSTFHDDMEEKIDNVAQNFDADLVSGEFLKWLSTWLAIAVDDRWNEAQLRELVKNAPAIYKIRGTKGAIEKMVEIYTGKKPFIIEYFQYKHLKDEPEFKRLVSELYGMDEYTFSVIVESEAVPLAQQRLALQKILDEEKPAYTEARLVVLKPWIYLDMHTYIGVNTRLSGYSSMRLDPQASMLYNNRLEGGDEEEAENENR